MQGFIACAYYSAGSGYKAEAVRLQKSAILHRVPIDVIEAPNHGSWQSNTIYKARFIEEMLLKHRLLNILYVDADAIFHAYPLLFDRMSSDFALHYRDRPGRPLETLSGTLYVAQNDRALAFIKSWQQINAQNPAQWDQRNLHLALRQKDPALKISALPIEYCAIFDDHRRHSIRPVIEHFQASRRLKNTIRRLA